MKMYAFPSETPSGEGDANEMVGYNYQRMEQLGTKVGEVAKETKESVMACMQGDIITPMAKLWYAPEAVKFFNEFNKNVVVKSGDELKKAFDNFLENVSKIQDSWSDKTGKGKKGDIPKVGKVELSVDVSAFKEENNGNIVLYTTRAINFAGTLEGIQKKLSESILQKKDELGSEVRALLGEDQPAALGECFQGVLDAVGNIFTYLSVGENSLKSNIEAAAKSYSQMGQSVTSGLRGAGSSGGSTGGH